MERAGPSWLGWVSRLWDSRGPHVALSTSVTFDGRRSSDPDGGALAYIWSQLAGPFAIARQCSRCDWLRAGANGAMSTARPIALYPAWLGWR